MKYLKWSLCIILGLVLMANAMPPLHEKNLLKYQALLQSDSTICKSSSFMQSAGTFRVLAILVEFSDKPHSVVSTYFD